MASRREPWSLLRSEACRIPSLHAEFEIQAALFIALRKRNIDVRGEVHGVIDGILGICDLVVYDELKRPKILIEVKQAHRIVFPKQRAWYESFCIPVLYCIGKHEVAATVTKVMTLAERFDKLVNPKPNAITPLRMKCRYCVYMDTNTTDLTKHVEGVHPVNG